MPVTEDPDRRWKARLPAAPARWTWWQDGCAIASIEHAAMPHQGARGRLGSQLRHCAAAIHRGRRCTWLGFSSRPHAALCSAAIRPPAPWSPTPTARRTGRPRCPTSRAGSTFRRSRRTPSAVTTAGDRRARPCASTPAVWNPLPMSELEGQVLRYTFDVLNPDDRAVVRGNSSVAERRGK